MKDATIKIRLTKAEKAALAEYAARHEISMSEVVRVLCEKIFWTKQEN